MKRMPVGIDDFRTLRTNGCYFVDKTAFLQDLIDGHAQVTLITRPRRFGKTLTLSMLHYFFTNENAEENRPLFDGCRIAGAGEAYMAEQGTRPVIFFSLKDVNARTYEAMLELLADVLREAYRPYVSLLESEHLIEEEKASFRQILGKKASEADMQTAVKALSQYIRRHYQRPALLLIDEYDAPIQSAWEHGYYDQAIGFFRNFLSSALKTNPALDFAVLTGVLRIAKESIFSALNNLNVSSVISGPYADVMGFTPEEVQRMANDLGHEDKLDEIRDWYDGYNFSGHEIYNPWSVINYFDRGCEAAPYWVNTSGNSILAELLEHADETQERNLYALLQMETIGIQIKDSVIYSDIYRDKAALYTMLLTTGYLKVIPGVFKGNTAFCAVAIPNEEIRTVYASEVLDKLQRLGRQPDPAAFMIALLILISDKFFI